MTKIITFVAVIYLFFLFFKVQGAFVRRIAWTITGRLSFEIVNITVAFTTAYVIYASIVVLGSISRVASIDDVFILLTARPSSVGGIGLFAVVVGAIFGFFSYLNWGYWQGGAVEGRTVRYETFSRRITVVGVLRKLLRR